MGEQSPFARVILALVVGSARREPAIQDLLQELIALLRARAGRHPALEEALDELHARPRTATRTLERAIYRARLVPDLELEAAAERVLQAADDLAFGVDHGPPIPSFHAFVPFVTEDEETTREHGRGLLSSRPVRRPRGATEPPPVAAPEAPRPPDRIVNTGFARTDDAGTPLSPHTALAPDTEHYFWLEIAGVRLPGAIGSPDAPSLPVDALPDDAQLHVTLFGFTDGLQISPGRDIGRLRLQPDGTWRVTHRPAAPRGVARELADRRLFFPVRAPAGDGPHRLRCNIYFRQILVQSLLIEAHVGRRPRRDALWSTVDYTLARALRPEHLSLLVPHRLSLMLNRSDDGTHGFRFFGEGDFKCDASLDGQALQNLIDQARRAERMAAWGDPSPFTGAQRQRYRYDGPPDLARLTGDLVNFARRGYRFYDVLIGRLAGSETAARQLHALMRSPGDIQIALKDTTGHVPPVAMIYDYPLDTAIDGSAIVLCPAFLAALSQDRPLHDQPCFTGECPSAAGSGALDIVCPGGFWGFRHRLGMPVAGPTSPDAPTAITFQGRPEIAVGVSTDRLFTAREEHERRLRALFGAGWHRADTRQAVLELLARPDFRASLVYFYCHGGLTEDHLPYILVGDPAHERGITRDNLRARNIRWQTVRPLVFINGCHTAAVEPEQAISLVTGFVDTAWAAGVIGTEISVFEPLATEFAEHFLRAFASERHSLGEAVRRARLALLARSNPLGLVYLPFALSTLRLVEHA